MGWFGTGWMWLFWIFALVAIVWFIRSIGSVGARSPEADDSPEAILKRRYARGDVSKEEYEQRLEDLRR